MTTCDTWGSHSSAGVTPSRSVNFTAGLTRHEAPRITACTLCQSCRRSRFSFSSKNPVMMWSVMLVSKWRNTSVHQLVSDFRCFLLRLDIVLPVARYNRKRRKHTAPTEYSLFRWCRMLRVEAIHAFSIFMSVVSSFFSVAHLRFICLFGCIHTPTREWVVFCTTYK